MEKSTRLILPENGLKQRIANGGSRAKVICLGTLCLAVGIANSMALTNTYNYSGVCPTPNRGKKILDKLFEWECECPSYAADKLNERGVPQTSLPAW